MIIDSSYFTSGELKIENVLSPENVHERADIAVTDDLNSYIRTYTPIYLEKILGCELSADLIAYINRTESEPIDKWEEIKKRLTVKTVSPLACYIYFHYVRSHQTSVTGVGVTMNNSDNKVVNPSQKLITAWNLMVNSNIKLINFIQSNNANYPGFYFDEEMTETINYMDI